ncbi:MAG: hypothetical protein ABEH40_06500 [Haloferacaceae archaeon]
MGDRITERAEALGLPWFSRTMRLGTVLLAVLLFAAQSPGIPAADPVTALRHALVGAAISVATAVIVLTWVKAASLVVRVPLSLYLYP